MPWTRQEKVSRILATLRGSRSKRFVSSREMSEQLMIATVLLAVIALATDTRAAIPNSAPFGPLRRLDRKAVIASIHPILLKM